jgi:hypothetical protein
MRIIRVPFAVCLTLLLSNSIYAGLVPINQLDFGSGATIVDFAGLPDGTDANGLALGGATFEVRKSGVPTNGIVIVDGGPGTTTNIIPPNLVSVGDPTDVALVISLPNLVTEFGYGYALLAFGSIPAASTVELFAGSTSLGKLAFTGIPDPTFTGGFGGVASDLPFDKAILTFSNEGEAFAVDNITFAHTVTDEGESLILLFGGILVLVCFDYRNSRMPRAMDWSLR